LKNCPHCNAELPDEAFFCLSCATVLNPQQEPPKKAHNIRLNKRMAAVCVSACLVIVISFIALYRFTRLPSANGEPNETVTALVPVTQENGETVTDPQGNTVYEAVVIETTTKKGSVFSDLIGGIFGNGEESTAHTDAPPVPSDPTDSTVGTTKAPQQTSTDPTKPPETTQEDIIANEDPAAVFEYEPYSNSTTKIAITKYKGNSSYVTVPDYINGLMVVRIKSNAFQNNSKIKTIDIVKGERSYIWLDSNCFNNLTSLTTVNLYDNDLGLYADFAPNCPIKDFNITYWQYRFVNGAIYEYNSRDWELKVFCGNPCYNTLTIESWCKIVSNDNNLDDAKNLKVINIHKDVTTFSTFGFTNKSIEAINVESGNEKFMSKDGVLFTSRQQTPNVYDAFYPAGKKDKTFTMPQQDGKTFCLSAGGAKAANTYVEEIYFPLNSKIEIGAYSSSFPNLKKLYFQNGNSCYDDVRFQWTGECQLY